MADYDAFAEQYHRFKESPFCRFAEEPTYFTIIGDLEGKSVLDLACGEGHYTRLIKTRGAARVVGVDYAEGMVALAREQEERAPLGIEYRVGDAARLGRLGDFDLVTASYLLNYAPDRGALIDMCRSAHENLKPGGRLVTLITNGDLAHEHYSPASDKLKKYNIYFIAEAFPCTDGTPVKLYFCKDEVFSVTMYHYDGATYKAALEEVGFKDVRSCAFTITPEGFAAMPAGYWRDFIDIAPLVCVEGRR